MTEQRQVWQEKAKKEDEIRDFLKERKVIALAGLHKVRAAQLQELRKKLQDVAHLRVIKNSLMKRVIRQYENKPNLDKLEDHLTGSTIFLFTGMNPFKLVLLLEKSKVRTTAKAGDVAAFDVVVPAGNTGQPPGPIISQLGAVGLKTRIESGSVWVNKDTLVVEEGQPISERLAAVLSKLGIKPVEVGLVLRAAYDDGLIITEEQLALNIDEFRKNVEEAFRNAFSLSVNSAYTTHQNITFLLQKANQDAYKLGLSKNIPTKATIEGILRKAHLHMLGLERQLGLTKEKAQKG